MKDIERDKFTLCIW